MVWSSSPNPNCQAAPTQAPSTLQPTGAPTPFNSCPGFRIQSGTGGTGNSSAGETPRYAGLAELHETTCCSDQPISGFQPPSDNCTVYSERDAGNNGANNLICHPSANWTSAWAMCNSIGARLCTAAELINGCGAGLGCNFNQHMIWSSTVNPNCQLPAPTLAPSTFAPTAAPTRVNNCPGFKVMRGDSRADPNQGRFASANERHSVTCCANTIVANATSFFFPPDPTRSNCTVFSERDAGGLTGCFADATYQQATAFCSAVGGRLCTAVEIGQGCGQGTGCQFDQLSSWTSTPNPFCNGLTATPTLAPTASPTKVPTMENSCPGYMIQAGNGGAGGQGGDRPRFAGTLQIHGVTCCSDDPLAGFVRPNATSNPRCPVWSERDGAALGGCLVQSNWSAANAFCQNGGARLCTPQELVLGCGVGTGCNHNQRMVWSSAENPYCNGQTATPTTAPTAPTAAPTLVPTPVAACPGYRVVNGRGGDWPTASGEPSRWASPLEQHEVTCCSDVAINQPGNVFRAPRNHTITSPSGSTSVAFCPVYAERDFSPTGNGSVCGHSMTWQAASDLCTARSARLCTRAELELGCGQGSGCQHDEDVVWSSTVRASSAPALPHERAATDGRA